MKDIFTKNWIIENSIEICSRYDKGILTLRALHYQLVGIGMTNDVQHYKRVVTAMIDARWDDKIEFDQFSDLDRVMVGDTPYKETNVSDAVDQAKDAIYSWMNYYGKNKWENQEYYPEVFIEKKALQGVFNPICRRYSVSLGACKGYPSLTFLHEASLRFKEALQNDKIPIIVYFGDYDPSGEDIPRSIEENMIRFGISVEVRRIALMKDQVLHWNLPPAPAKVGDSRTANWDGLGQVELDAVKPEDIEILCRDALDGIFDDNKYSELQAIEETEQSEYRSQLLKYIEDLNR
jgi:hypothetical protein